MKIVKVEKVNSFEDYQEFIRENQHIEIVNVISINGETCVTYREESFVQSLREEHQALVRKLREEDDYKYLEDHNKNKMIHRIELDDDYELVRWIRENSIFRFQHIYREEGKIIVIYV